MKKDIGYRIRKLREGKDYTQDNMAGELGITAGAYAKIERGETDASITRLMRIAEILEVDIITFFKENPTYSKVEEPISPYGFASKADIEKLMQLIKQMNSEIEQLKSDMAAPPKGKKHKIKRP